MSFHTDKKLARLLPRATCRPSVRGLVGAPQLSRISKVHCTLTAGRDARHRMPCFRGRRSLHGPDERSEIHENMAHSVSLFRFGSARQTTDWSDTAAASMATKKLPQSATLWGVEFREKSEILTRLTREPDGVGPWRTYSTIATEP